MSEDNVEVVNEQTPEQSFGTEQPSEKKVAKTAGVFTKRFIMFSILIMVMASTIKLYQEIQILKSNLDPNAFLQQDNMILEQLTSQQKQLTTDLRLMEKQQSVMSDAFKQLQEDIEQVRTQQSNHAVMLSDRAEYQFMLERAAFKLSVDQDAKGASVILKMLANKASAAKARTLANKINQVVEGLQPFATLDSTSILTKLQALEKSLMQQPLQTKEHFNDKHPGKLLTNHIESKAEQTKEDWRNRLLDSVKQVVIVQRMDLPVKPLLNEHEKALVHYQFKLKLQQLEMAVLSNHFDQFSSLLAQLRQDASMYMTIDDDSELGKNFKTLSDMTLPKQFPSLKEVRREIQRMKEKTKT